MAKTLITTDDLDGSAEAETIRFSYNGTSYTIDLGKKNRAAFEKAMKPYIEVAQKASGRRPAAAASGTRRSRSGRRRSSSSVDLAAVRAWARESGIEVSERGRIAQSVIDAYQEANA
jgi:hypothetical protein